MSYQIKYKAWFRVTAFVTLAALLFTSIPSDAFSVSVDTARPAAINDKDVPQFNIPPDLGAISDQWHSATSDRLVIHIQDAHCEFSAQQKISEIIGYIRMAHGASIVNIEGGCGIYDLTGFDSLPEDRMRSQAADSLMKEGLLNGAEHYAVTRPGRVALWGVEDADLYLSDLKAFRSSVAHKADIARYLDSVDRALSALKTRIYSEEMSELDGAYLKYAAGGMDLTEYAAFLTGLATKHSLNRNKFPNIRSLNGMAGSERQIDFARADAERDALLRALQSSLSRLEREGLSVMTAKFGSGTISSREYHDYLAGKASAIGTNGADMPELHKYRDYLRIYSTIDQGAIVGELQALKDDLTAILCADQDQREIDSLSRNLALMRGFFGATVTKEDYRYYKTNRGSFAAERMARSVNRLAAAHSVAVTLDGDIGKLDGYRGEMEKFYDMSDRRDEAFVRNMRFSGDPAPDGRPSKIAILVTGGFHSENLRALFRRSNISYVSIMPRFKPGDPRENPYFRLLSGDYGTGGLGSMVRSMQISRLAIASILNGLGRQVMGKEQYAAAVLKMNMEIARSGGLNGIRVVSGGDSRYFTLDGAEVSAGDPSLFRDVYLRDASMPMSRRSFLKKAFIFLAALPLAQRSATAGVTADGDLLPIVTAAKTFLTWPISSEDPAVQRFSAKAVGLFNGKDVNVRFVAADVGRYVEERGAAIAVDGYTREMLTKGTARAINLRTGGNEYTIIYDIANAREGIAAVVTGLAHEILGHISFTQDELRGLSPMEEEAVAFRAEIRYLEALIADRRFMEEFPGASYGVISDLREQISREKRVLAYVEKEIGDLGRVDAIVGPVLIPGRGDAAAGESANLGLETLRGIALGWWSVAGAAIAMLGYLVWRNFTKSRSVAREREQAEYADASGYITRSGLYPQGKPGHRLYGWMKSLVGGGTIAWHPDLYNPLLDEGDALDFAEDVAAATARLSTTAIRAEGRGRIRVLVIGTGTGFDTITAFRAAKKRGMDATIHTIDIDPKAAAVFAVNKRLLLKGLVNNKKDEVRAYTVKKGEEFDALLPEYDLVVFNSPDAAITAKKSPALEISTGDLTDLLSRAASRLSSRGLFLLRNRSWVARPWLKFHHDPVYKEMHILPKGLEWKGANINAEDVDTRVTFEGFRPNPQIGRRARGEITPDRKLRILDSSGSTDILDLASRGSLDLTALKASISEMLQDDSHRDTLLSVLSLLEGSPPELFVYNKLVEDLFGVAVPGEGAIAVHNVLADEPVALFHEVMEYMVRSGKINIRPIRSGTVIRIGVAGTQLSYAITVNNEDARNQINKGRRNPHYLIRAIQRQVFGDKDSAVSQKISLKQMEWPDEISELAYRHIVKEYMSLLMSGGYMQAYNPYLYPDRFAEIFRMYYPTPNRASRLAFESLMMRMDQWKWREIFWRAYLDPIYTWKRDTSILESNLKKLQHSSDLLQINIPQIHMDIIEYLDEDLRYIPEGEREDLRRAAMLVNSWITEGYLADKDPDNFIISIRRLHAVAGQSINFMGSVDGLSRPRINDVKNPQRPLPFPSPYELEGIMRDLARDVCSDGFRSKHPVLQAAEIYQRLTDMQYFNDGNRRVAKLIMDYYLMRNHLPALEVTAENKDEFQEVIRFMSGPRDVADFVAKQLLKQNEFLRHKGSVLKNLVPTEDIERDHAISFDRDEELMAYVTRELRTALSGPDKNRVVNVMISSGGETMRKFFRSELVKAANLRPGQPGYIDLSRIRLILSTEWVGSLQQHKDFVSEVESGLPRNNRFREIVRFDDSYADPQAAVEDFKKKLDAIDVDLAIMGIGPEGQLGYNERGTRYDSGPRIARLENYSRFYGGLAQRRVFTVGIADIMRAKRIVVVSMTHADEDPGNPGGRTDKALAISRAFRTLDVPASALRMKDDRNFLFLLDSVSASAVRVRMWEGGERPGKSEPPNIASARSYAEDLARRAGEILRSTRYPEEPRFIFIPVSEKICPAGTLRNKVQEVWRSVRGSSARNGFRDVRVIFYDGTAKGLDEKLADLAAGGEAISRNNALAYIDSRLYDEGKSALSAVTLVREEIPQGGTYISVGGHVALALGILDIVRSGRSDDEYIDMVAALAASISAHQPGAEPADFRELLRKGDIEGILIRLPPVEKLDLNAGVEAYFIMEEAAMKSL